MRSVKLQENVEIVLAAYSRFNTGDRSADALEIWDEVGEFHPAPEDPEFSVHRGIDAIRHHYANWVDAYPDLTLEPLEAMGRGDTVYLWVHCSGRSRESGIPLSMRLAHVITMRDGRISRLLVYRSKSEALRAAGLSEYGEVGGRSQLRRERRLSASSTASSVPASSSSSGSRAAFSLSIRS
jgi:ketosteroid isomerase-like protein